MIVVVCIVAIVAAANAVWWLAGLALLGALMLGTAEYLADESEAATRRRIRAELRRGEHEEYGRG